MQDPDERAAYEQRKEDRAEKRRSTSRFDYQSAGGNYVPTQAQYDTAFNAVLTQELTPEQESACHQIMYGFSCQERVHHDNIHIVNELMGGIIYENYYYHTGSYCQAFIRRALYLRS